MPWGCCPEDLQARLAIGGQFEPAELEQTARQKPGWKRTDHAGWQNRRGLLDMLGRARVGVVPFLPAANHTDCQPTKLFEYMIAGLPVVATDLLQLGKIVKDTQCGILVEPGNPQAMADAIQWLLEHPEEAHAMGDRGRQSVAPNLQLELASENLVTIVSPGDELAIRRQWLIAILLRYRRQPGRCGGSRRLVAPCRETAAVLVDVESVSDFG